MSSPTAEMLVSLAPMVAELPGQSRYQAQLGNEEREFLTDQFLATPGTVASFKIYVRLATGNEAGSQAVSVSRPV